jgi:drug/metabolite transporter (DMT)-like permease
LFQPFAELFPCAGASALDHAPDFENMALLQWGGRFVGLFGLAQLGLSTVVFLLGATVAKQWGITPSFGKIVLILVLYSLGNLIMLRLIREFGMSVSFSLSAVIQLVCVNVVALVFYGERISALQAAGVAMAIASVALITLGPYFQGR